MSSGRYLAAFRHWWWLPILTVVVAAGISYAVAQRLPRVYEAHATLLVNFTPPQAPPTYNDALLSQQLVKTYTQMVVQPVVLEQVGPVLGRALTAEDLEPVVAAQPVRDTQLFTISAQALEPDLARDVANTVANVFIAQQDERLSQNAVSSAISVVQPARLPVAPTEPRVGVDVAFASLIGLLVGLGLVYLLAWLDDTLKNVAEVERASDAPVLGVIPHVSNRSSSSRARSTEAYRLVRTALDFATAGQPVRTLLVTSPGSAEGKSSVVANLSVATAQAGARVVVVDADLRKPALHRYFGLTNEYGVTDLLQPGRLSNDVEDHCRGAEPSNLRVLTAGPASTGATELLQSKEFAQLLENLMQRADVVILDSPPVLAVADALVLAGQTDATLLVVKATRTRSVALRRASVAFTRSGTRLLGVVLNDAPSETETYPSQALPRDRPGRGADVTSGRAAGREG
ncbi:MAG: polysaccharide biosynthesis tyrosine autokinase [Chloroflexi bacterium]|nr:polysaccharide biosynthesis tyrosine autokinase [Chloroflexota bacterium]